MEKNKSYTQQELAEIRLEVSKFPIITFRDIYDLKEIKRWAETAWENNLVLWNYMEKVRMTCLEKGRGDLWEEWKKNNKMTYVGFQTLNDLEADLTTK